MTKPSPLTNKFKCIFCCLAPAEMSFSLRILANPAENPVYTNWAKRKFDGLSSNLKQEIEFFNNHYQWYFITDTAIYLIGEEEICMDDISVLLSRLKELDRLTFAYIFLGLSTSGYGAEILESCFDAPEHMDETLLHSLEKYIKKEDIFYFFKHVEEIRQRLIHLYRQYWVEMFRQEWRELRNYEQEIVTYQKIQYQHDDPIHYLQHLHPDLSVEEGILKFQKEDPFKIKIEDIRTLVIKPSVFVGETLSGNIVGDKVTITLNQNFHRVKTARPLLTSMADLISVLDDTSRLRIIKILWNYDATTKELSEILELSPGTVSLHLKMMREAGLVTSRKVRKYVYYQLRKDKFYGMEQKLLRYLMY